MSGFFMGGIATALATSKSSKKEPVDIGKRCAELEAENAQLRAEVERLEAMVQRLTGQSPGSVEGLGASDTDDGC